jgi:putative ABC transport system permease protein
MSFMDGLRYRIRVLLRPDEVEREMDEEQRHHLALDSAQHSERLARRRFGNAALHAEERRRASGVDLFDQLRLDARHLMRALRRSPGFALVAIATLALGIGATTAVVSVADHVLVRSLPFRDAGRIMMMLESDAHGGFRTPSAPTAFDWQKDAGAARAFEGLTFVRGDGLPLRVGEETRDVGVAFVEPHFFSVIGVKAARGRLLLDSDHPPSAERIAVISHRLWQSRFGGDENIVGRSIEIDKVPIVVVGVLPVGAVYPPWADAYAPLSHYTKPDILRQRGFHADSRTIARLRDDVDSTEAVALMRTVGARLAADFPAEQAGWMPNVRPMRNEIIGNLRPMLLTLTGAALAVLLLACVNIANLLLVRVATRSRELAIRSAIGASRWRIARQLLTESMLLSGVGGAVGVAIAALGVRLGKASINIPRADELTLDLRILGIAAGATVITALLCGLWPSFHATRTNADQVLRSGALTAAGRHEARLRRALVTVQFALALVLLVGSGLLVQSFRRASTVDLGIDPVNLMSIRIAPPPGAYPTPAAAADLYKRLMDATSAVAGAESAFIQHSPFGRASITTTLEIEGRASLDSSNQVFYRTVSDSYFRTMRMRLAAGQWFDANDMQAPGGRFVVNEQFARQYLGGASPLGRRIVVRRASQARADFGERLPGVIVGVVADVRNLGPDVPPAAEVYVPYTLETWNWGMLMMRASTGLAARPALAQAIRSVDARLLKEGAESTELGLMSDALKGTLQPRRITMTLVSAFGICALLLAGIGMYGVAAYSIAQRTREIGVRKALGATDSGIASMLLRESLIVTGVGIVAGGAAAYGAASLIRGLLFNTSLTEPTIYVGTIALLTSAAVGATLLPARRAMRLDPTIAMRGD